MKDSTAPIPAKHVSDWATKQTLSIKEFRKNAQWEEIERKIGHRLWLRNVFFFLRWGLPELKTDEIQCSYWSHTVYGDELRQIRALGELGDLCTRFPPEQAFVTITKTDMMLLQRNFT